MRTLAITVWGNPRGPSVAMLIDLPTISSEI